MDGILVSDQNWWTRFLRRHPNLDLVLFLVFMALLGPFVCWLVYRPPEVSATVSSFRGLDPGHRAAAPPTFAVTLRARNRDAWRHCFKPGNGSAVVSYAGVPLARADLPGFCVPALSAATVRFVATGDGFGMPDELHESMEGQRARRERVALAVRVRLDEDLVVPHNPVDWSPMLTLYWCEAMLDGHPPSQCAAFRMTKR
ncbi:hypothetical protein SETIT_5G335000v2 [Setaria italica]|uniref:Late embryogenesis abundant protein LEA-2 subgroup domain-containing protein n=2 Tax=Setaria TaxID=4554 RepID=K3XPV9_SETIT|nr:hypothetical protein SETIT_5G335000v2 [Setaria italica]TKW17036.1 hypothetical protein SEVIR_5G339200v2 [Setaria viridis]